MGMLMHHTWLEEQEKNAPQKREEKPVEIEPETEPEKKVSRRKTSK